MQDTREVVRQAKELLLSKNEGNLIQDFIWQTTQFDPKAVSGPNAPVSKDTAKRDGDEALQGLRTLGTLLITNGQFRKLREYITTREQSQDLVTNKYNDIVKDATVLARDMVGDGASSAANLVRPSEEQLSQIDQAAPDNTWHEAPKFSKDDLKNQAKGIYSGNAKKDAKDIAAAATDSSQNPHADGGEAAKSAVSKKIDENVDEETKEKIRKRNEEYRRKAREYLNKKMPQERKDQVIWRLKKIVLECQQHPDYSQAIQALLRLAEEYGKHGSNYSKGSAGSAKEARSGFAAAEADLRTLLERFANGTSTEDLWASIGQIYEDANKDPELKGWFKNFDSFIRRCLLEQGYVLEDASTHEWNRLNEQGRYLLREKYRSHTNRVVDELKFIADQFDQDSQNKAFGASVQKLFKDLGNDENGKAAFKPHLLKDLTDVIIPGVLENIAYIPIPRIEYSDPKFDAIIENLVLESDNFMPNILEISSDNYFRWGRKKIANKNKNTIDIKVSGVQMDLRDVSFHVKRKAGFPKITDTGVVDILLPGDGFSFRMKVSTADKHDSQHMFKVEKVDVDVKGLKLNVKQSKYKLLFALVKPIALKALRPALQAAIEKAIKDQCNELDTFLFEVKKEADRAKEQIKNDPEQAVNIYKRYYDAAQKRMLQGKKKAKEATEDKKVNVAMTKHDSIFPEISLPGGISSKATEYKDLAAKGDKWESPVFSIGNAKKSTNIPSAPKIERKSHPVSNGHSNGHANGHGNGHTNLASNGNGYGNGNGFSNGGLNTKPAVLLPVPVPVAAPSNSQLAANTFTAY